MKKALSNRGLIDFVGAKNFLALLGCSLVGIGWFMTETAFVYIVQIFFGAIGILEPAKLSSIIRYNVGFNVACALLISFALIRFFVTVGRSFLSTYVQQGFVYHLRTQLFEQALKGEITLSAHAVMGLFSEMTNNAGVLFYNLAILTVNLFSILFFIAGGFWIAPFEMAIGLVTLFIVVWPLRLMSRNLGQIGEEIQIEWDRVNAQLSTSIRNKFLLKIYRLESIETQRGEKTLRTYFRHQKTFAFWNGLASAVPIFIGVCSVIVICYFSRRYSNTKPMDLIAFLYIFMRLAQVGSESNTVVGFIRFYTPSLSAIYKWLNEARRESKKDVQPNAEKVARVERLQLKDVSFSFGPRSLFNGVSVDLSSGDALTVTGPSGTGKSTFLSLVTGIAAPTQGQVLINGLNSFQVSPEWTERIAYVGPDPFMIEGTIRQNLLFGNKNHVSDERIWATLEAVAMAKPVGENSDGLDYRLKSASRFSSGQLQRLSIARALLRDFDVLIFDEGTAHLDIETAKEITAEIAKAVQSKIFIRVTHQDLGWPSGRRAEKYLKFELSPDAVKP